MTTTEAPTVDKIVTKAVEATIENVPDAEATSQHGSFRVRLVVPGEDREGDDLQRKGWKLPLPEHIVFDTDHTMRVEKTVGSGKPEMLDDGSIEVPGDYAPTAHAQLVRSLVPKHIKTVSVTYLERRTKGAGGRVVHRELLGGSFVPIPANPKAVVLSSKAVGGDAGSDDPDEAVEASLAQQIHDDAVKLGAECNGESEADDDPEPEGKAFGAGRLELVNRKALTYYAGPAFDDDDNDDALLVLVDKAAAPYGAVPYADPGYLDASGKPAKGGNGVKRYALDTPKRVRAAASYFGDPANHGQYTAAQQRAISAKIRGAASRLGVDIAEDSKVGKTKSVDPLERALEYLVAGGMTREAASEQLGITYKSVILAPSEAATAVTADSDRREAATTSAADEAAAPLDQRLSTLLTSLDDAAG